MELRAEALEKVYLRLEALKRYIGILKGLQNTTLDELTSDLVKRGAIERYLQLAIEACIDIAELIISDQRFSTPQSAKETIEILGREGILDTEFAREFSKASGFRNILIHDYLEIDDRELLKNLQINLSDFDHFIKSVLEFIKTAS